MEGKGFIFEKTSIFSKKNKEATHTYVPCVFGQFIEVQKKVVAVPNEKVSVISKRGKLYSHCMCFFNRKENVV